jgi:hypothetical protein
MSDLRDTLVPIAIAVSVGLAIVFGLHACGEERRRAFRAECESQGGEVTTVMMAEGDIALACRPTGAPGPILIVPHHRSTLAPGRSP